ncbi:DEAD/DEAH box helicase [Streptomyces sp. JJ36]|uniref:DEAD/DEAH box helicase n=1 Tax=Streptomyces sp. JJ36 TaxID=2736645 RepID=UPI001F1C8914|nr:DEAD/DEAH box helicase [Streptomyces sp. JJ36]
MNNGTDSAGSFILRPHQKEAVAAILRGLSDVGDGEARGTVVMATGTGKTITAAAAAHQLVPHGRCGVLVPTLDLLAQTAEAWRRAGHRGRMAAVCSLEDDPLLEALDVQCTTDPAQLARWAAGCGPVVVLATYASLVPQSAREEAGEDAAARRGVLERAVRGEGFSGPSLPVFDLLIVDEAHRTSGDLGKSWAAALCQGRVPAVRRLFMTATPRLWEAPPASGGEGRLVASMDDEALYGRVLFELGLMEAVERGLLARWEIDVLEITDPQAPGPDEDVEGVEEAQGRRLAALQAALLTHLDGVSGRSLLTFHSTTLAAMAMARSLPGTAAELHSGDSARYPARVGADWLSGEHPATHRREVLGRFAGGITEDGWVADAQILASCQVLAEGVDIRGQAGVDGVVLADARSSPVQIVQILGRALRQEPGEGKVARIIVPVYLAPGERPDAMMTSGAYRPLVQVLQGLRAHDERIVQRLMLATTTASGEPSNVLELDPGTPEPTAAGHTKDGRTDDRDQEHDQEQQDEQEREEREESVTGVPLLRFSQPRDPAAIARWLRTRVIQPDSEVWLTGYEALRQWVDQHGDANVPTGAAVDLDEREGYPVGQWVSEQRRALAGGALRPHRYQLLDELGMIWDVADARFTNGLTAARAYFEEFSTLAAPRDAVVDGFPVGQWLENLRKGVMAVTEKRDSALREIDPYWNPAWPVSWQRRYAALAYLLQEEEGVPEVPPGVRVHGTDVGTWLHRQTTPVGWAQLAAGQRQLLEQLGIQVPEETGTGTQRGKQPAPVPGLEGLDAFERGLAACKQYLAREGHLTVPRGHEEMLHPAGTDGTPVTVRPGVFLSNQKARRARLTPARRQALAELGLDWAR